LPDDSIKSGRAMLLLAGSDKSSPNSTIAVAATAP